MLQLIGHSSETTAFKIDGYFPYYFGTHTSARYWVETHKSYGQRFVHTYLDPVTGEWTKPKSSSYTGVIIMLVQDDPRHPQYGCVDHTAFNFKTAGKEELEQFSKQWYFDEHQKAQVTSWLSGFYASTFQTIWKPRPPVWTSLSLQPINTLANQQAIQSGQLQPVAFNQTPANLTQPVLVPEVSAVEQEIEQIRLYLETFEPWTLEQDRADPVGAKEYMLGPIRAQQRLNFLLGIEHVPLTNDQLKRNG